MFSKCSSLISLDVSNFNTSNVTNMTAMFQSCSSLTSLNVSKFDTSKATNISYMFNNCSSLISLDVSNFDTSKVTNMRVMFQLCSSLTSLDLSNFDTSNVTDMHYMFYGLSLNKLNLCSFDTSKVTDMSNMFQNNNALKVVYVSNKWNMDSVTNKTDMFTNSGVTDVTKSDTCMEDAIKDLVELSISTTKTSNSIKAVANVFYASSGVKTYEYSIDGVNYITSDTNVYTFNNLESNKTYKVYVKVTTNNGGSAESSAEVTTDSLSPATFKEVNDKVLINYPTTTGLYKTGDSEYKEGNMTSDSGVVIAKVTDGIKTVYSSYNRISA